MTIGSLRHLLTPAPALPLTLRDADLLYAEYDLALTLTRPCFLDHLSLTLEGALGGLVLLAETERGLRPIGRLDPATGGLLESGRLTIPVGRTVERMRLRFVGGGRTAILRELELLGADGILEAVYPTPAACTVGDGILVPTGITAAGEDAAFAAAVFAEQTGLSTDGGNVRFALDGALGCEAFTITVTETEAVVLGGSRRALLYAAAKLAQLLTEGGIRTATIDDAPKFPFRGVHIALPDRAELPFIRRLIRHLLVPMGYNTLILEIAGAMEYRSHPKINEAWLEACEKYEAGEWPMPAHYGFVGRDILTQDEVRELCAYARAHGMEVIPEVQSYGHTQYVTMAYPELGERDAKQFDNRDIALIEEDERPSSFYYHCMCAKHPDYYRIIFALLDEVVEVVRPERFVHIGHDEIYQLGTCPRCQGTDPADLYTEEVTALHDHIAALGLRTMLWSDMMEEKNYRSTPAIDRIPRDIVCLSFTWYFHLFDGLETETRLLERGFPVAVGNLYSSHFPRFNERMARGMLGGEVSIWVPANYRRLCYEGKIYDFAYTADWLWQGAGEPDQRLTRDAILDRLMPDLREALGDTVSRGDEVALPFPGSPDAVPYDLRHDYAAAIAVPPGQSVTIPVGACLTGLTLRHATDRPLPRVMWADPTCIGQYRVSYADGSEWIIPIEDAADLCCYRGRYAAPLPSPLYRHEGYTATCLATPIRGKTVRGEDYTLYATARRNPDPTREIASITLERNEAGAASLLLFGVDAWKN